MDFEKCRKAEEEYARFLTERYFPDRDAMKAVKFIASGVFYEDEITEKLVRLNREPGTKCYADPEESVDSSKPVTETTTGLPKDVSSMKRNSKKNKKSS